MKLRHWFALALMAAASAQAGAQALVTRVAGAPAAQPAATSGQTVEIFSTLSSDPSAIYDYGWGPSILGPRWYVPGNGHGPAQYWGVTFTPAIDISLTQVVLPLARDINKDLQSVRVSLYCDAAGLPGEALQTWKGLKMQHALNADNTARTCCTYSVLNAKPGQIGLKGGTPYWLVVSTLPNSHFTGIWYYNSIGAKGMNAWYGGLGIWQQQPDALLPAVGIYGAAQ